MNCLRNKEESTWLVSHASAIEVIKGTSLSVSLEFWAHLAHPCWISIDVEHLFLSLPIHFSFQVSQHPRKLERMNLACWFKGKYGRTGERVCDKRDLNAILVEVWKDFWFSYNKLLIENLVICLALNLVLNIRLNPSIITFHIIWDKLKVFYIC